MFSASDWAVRGVWRRWRKERGVRAEDVAIPVEMGPGEVAQVDFGWGEARMQSRVRSRGMPRRRAARQS
jgi:hypothetical protein